MKASKSRKNLHNSSRRQENGNVDLVDRISSLPDAILGVILSFLPTKYAVATSILSKRWKLVWTTVNVLAFFNWGSPEEPSEDKDMKFVEFVNRVLLLLDARFLNSFTLIWTRRCNFVHVSSWIGTAITRNVQELILGVENRVGPYCIPEPMEIPVSVFNCDSLRDLELNTVISVTEADVICFPRLENLKLFSVYFESCEVFANLISGCPMLNHLHIHMDIDYMSEYFKRGDDEYMYIISSTSLRRLELCVYEDIVYREIEFHCSLILVEAPSLEYLELAGVFSNISVQKSLSSLVEVDFKIEMHGGYDEPMICNSFVEVVCGFDCAKTITLSGDAMWALSHAEISLSTEFKRLVKLEIEIYCCHCCWPLRDFIQCSDNLEVLTIYQDPDSITRRDLHVHSNWNAPVEVPTCLSNSLKRVIVDVYCGFADVREMIRYILKNGSVLEVMKIKCDRNLDDVKFELAQQLLKFPRNSSACEVEFVVDTSSPVVTSSSSSSLSSSS